MRAPYGLLATAVAGALLAPAAPAGAVGHRTHRTDRVSVTSTGGEADAPSSEPAVSADGHLLAFTSTATNLVPGDTNDAADIFLRDLRTGATERISLTGVGGQADGPSYDASLSADGRWIAFMSSATDLVPGDTNDAADIFLRDRRTGVTERISVSDAGGQAGGHSFSPTVSADGRYVCFDSFAADLVPGDTNGLSDVFVRDRWTGRTERVSLTRDGGQVDGRSAGSTMSADGRWVAFVSNGTALVPGDTNGIHDVFLRDRRTGRTERISLTSTGDQADNSSIDPALSADGRYVAFASNAGNLVPGDTNGLHDVFLRDRRTGRTERISVVGTGEQANSASLDPTISADGRYVAFASNASNLVPGDTNGVPDVFLRDRRTGRTERVSVTAADGQADSASVDGVISADGHGTAFTSAATNLVGGDFNGAPDVFERRRR